MRKILPLLILLVFVTGCTARERDGGEVVMFGGHEDLPPVVHIQNEYLRLEFFTETAEIVLTDLDTGEAWRSTPEDLENAPNLEPIERFTAQSLFVLTFETRTGAPMPYDAYRYSIRNGNFEHEIIGETLELRFTVGDIVRTFEIPNAIYHDRLEGFLEGLPRADAIMVRNAFSPVSLARLPSGTTASQLIERFPMLGEEDKEGVVIQVLQDSSSEFMLESVEGILREAGYTHEDWVEDMHYFNLPTEIESAAFNVIMRFELDRNDMVVTVPMNEITYVPAFMPTQLNVLPYFGAAREFDDGYVLLPDGSGAIMYFDSGRYTQLEYFNNVYGWDEAIIREEVLHDNRAAYPVFGVYRNGATLTTIIEEGSSYASIRALTAGIRAPYTRVHPLFRLLHGAPLDVRGRTNDSMLMHEWELPNEDIVIRYSVTRGDGYVGMAEAYREFLQERYPWLNQRVSEPVHATVEILGAALTSQHILGFPVERPFPLTSYNEAADIMEVLHGFGWRNIHVKMRGAHNESLDHAVPSSLDIISQLGGRRGFDNMVGTAERLGFPFYLEGDFMFMRLNEMFNGFSPMRDAARQANRERAEHAGYSAVYFGALGTGFWISDPVIIARPEYTINLAQNFVEEAADRGVNNMAFRSMASALSGDFNEDRHVTREASMNMRVDFLSGLRDNGTGIWLNYGFSYGAPFADVITGMPLTDQSFGITDVDVPFYQIALHGLIPFAGRPLNLAEDNSQHFLKSIESGSMLFFSFMNVSTDDIEITRYRRYFANEFGRWQDVANEVYTNYVNNFGHLYNQLIVDHQILNRVGGVTVTVYEDGTRVYVNTTMMDFVTDTGITIPARSINGPPPYVVVNS